MNLSAFLFICLTILVQQYISQDESTMSKLSCDNKDIQQYIVDRHNELRANVTPTPVNMLKMEWSDEAAVTAAEWAKKCTQAHSRAEQRKISLFGCGENLYTASRPNSWRKAIQGWYDEVNNFSFGKGAIHPDAVIGHYTQLVWYRSYLIGCALAFCPEKNLPFYYVCHYCPAGNMKGEIDTPYEEGDPCSKCKHSCINNLCDNPCLYYDDYDNCHEYSDLCDENEMVQEGCKATCNCDDEIQ